MNWSVEVPIRRSIAAAIAAAALAFAGGTVPAYADAESPYVVHTWVTGPNTATAGGGFVEVEIHLLQEDGELYVNPLVTDIDLVDPSGVARPSQTTVMYQIFQDWYPVPIPGGGHLPTLGQVYSRPLRVTFAADAPTGTWRMRARISQYNVVSNGGDSFGSPPLTQRQDWFSITVTGASTTPSVSPSTTEPPVSHAPGNAGTTGTGGLPVTGPRTGHVVTGGALLMLVGGVLLLASHRRAARTPGKFAD